MPEQRRTNPNKQRAVVYARVGSGHQHDSWSSQRQLDACRRWAKEHGLRVTREFTDIGVSGLDAERPALMQLFDYIETHPVDYVVCDEMTTLARDYLLSTQLILQAQAHDAKVAIASLDAVLDIHVGRLPNDAQPEEQSA